MGIFKKSAFDIDVNGFQLEIKRLSIKVEKAKPAVTKAAGQTLVEEVKKNLSSRKHTLQDLEALDNPYAKRHGKIQASALGGMKPYEIHDRNGKFASALRVDNAGGEGHVYFDEGAAEHIKYVLEGTRTMHGRDVIGGTLLQDGVKRKILQTVDKKLGMMLGLLGTADIRVK